MSSAAHAPNGQRAHSERPERSRNAKAQARHRAKRKAYIEQLEQTVTKLQTALGFTPEQVAALPPPSVRIRELEQENGRLHRENEELRRTLADPAGRNPHCLDLGRRDQLTTFHDGRSCDRELKRRKMNGNVEEVYMSPSDTPPHPSDALTRPPPLTIPQPLSHHYSTMSAGSHSGAGSSSSVFGLHASAFQIPNTPSGSSTASSPPFSQPAHMQQPQQQHLHASHPSHSPVNHRPPSMPTHHHQQTHHLSNFSHSANHYGSVKVEDENYTPPNHHTSHTHHYSLPSFAHTAQEHDLDTWNAYSSERPIHR